MHPGKHSYFGRTRGIETKGTLCISCILEPHYLNTRGSQRFWSVSEGSKTAVNHKEVKWMVDNQVLQIVFHVARFVIKRNTLI